MKTEIHLAKGADRSLFFIGFFLLIILALIIQTVLSSNSAVDFLPILILSISFSYCIKSSVWLRFWRPFIQMHLFVFPLCIAVVLAEKEGRVVTEFMIFVITDTGLNAGVLLYCKLISLFWCIRVLLTLWGQDVFLYSIRVLLFPLKFFGVDPQEIASVLHRALLLLPSLLVILPGKLLKGYDGLKTIFPIYNRDDTLKRVLPRQLLRPSEEGYYAWMYSMTLFLVSLMPVF